MNAIFGCFVAEFSLCIYKLVKIMLLHGAFDVKFRNNQPRTHKKSFRG